MTQILRQLIHPLYQSLETDIHPLRYLFLEITQKCNLHCRHCGSDCTKDARLRELTTRQWTDFLQKLSRDFSPSDLVLVITGGEPFCAPNFAAILARAGALGLRWGMVTNGYALTPKNIDLLLRHKIASITVSLDGLEITHNWLRGRKDSFKRAVTGIARLARSPIPFMDVVTCVHPGNLHELDDLKKLLVSLGVRYWRLFSIFPKGRAARNGELLLKDEGMKSLLDWIARQRKTTPRDEIVINFSCEGYLPKAVDRAVRDEPYFCRAGINIGSVLCDGSISACPNISRSLVQGNILTDDFKQVWEEKFEPFRKRAWMKKGPCKTCTEWKRCKGNSMHLWDDGKSRTAYCYHKLFDGV
jgi:radical SAM enzyme (rSAM/lipoprotein system)